MTDDDALLDSYTRRAFAKLAEVEEDPCKLEEPHRTLVLVTSAQGLIDNGGLWYFFESDWPGTPPYSLFAEAYERIGRTEAGAALRHAALSFGIAEPEKHAKERIAYMEQHYDEDALSVRGWDDSLCGDSEVWSDLLRWARKFRKE